ncbi:MAG: VCBS repeat-containing protein [Ignavibacteriae bacterium]|nr:VCBS repeat-containing protein [Ignavibacteriota bacterium]
MNTLNYTFKALLTTLLILFVSDSYSQQFTKVTDASNPIVTAPGAAGGTYVGASWIDYNGDGRLDLFWDRNTSIYQGLPGNVFVDITNIITSQGSAYGNTWADYDNDGDLDCFISGAFSTGSFLYRNDGGIFTKITSDSIGNPLFNKAWGCAWGDYNNDGYVDLVLAAAYQFGGILNPNRLYLNNGDGTFTFIDTTQITDSLDAFTVPTWNDYDLDGDIDLFIGSGPANGIGARDYIFHNYLKETGTAYFSRIDTGSMGTDIVDGQVWNWIDYDNDGDLDGFLTNYSNNINNKLYRNEGNYYFKSMTQAEVGTIVSDAGAYLSNIWQDFDNDGDLDCIVTRDNGQRCYYYNNNNDGTFTRVDTNAITTSTGNNFGATAGDYDKDGDVDVFVIGPNTTKGLFRNDNSNGNNWVSVTCKGVGGANGSNTSAIGTIVRLKATINGTPVWQIRQVLAQNSFNCQNAFDAHFGLGNATVIDSIEIRWTRGIVDVYTNVPINSFYNAIEGQSLDPVSVHSISSSIPESFNLYQNYPNPFNPSTNIKFDIKSAGLVTIKIYDMLGREVVQLVNDILQPGVKQVDWDGKDKNGVVVSSGVYFYKMTANGFTDSKRMVLVK